MMISDLLSIVSVLLSFLSAIGAMAAYQLSRRQVSSEVLFRIIDRLESPAMRDIRNSVYSAERSGFREWSDELKRDANTWGAELDVLSTLLATEKDMEAFFFLYGDVVIRSVYQLAPHGNLQRIGRGNQYLLPFRRFAKKMIGYWLRNCKQGKYASDIGMPYHPELRLSVNLLNEDEECSQFLK